MSASAAVEARGCQVTVCGLQVATVLIMYAAGGDSGIGRAVAVHFAREGADVAIVHLPDEMKDAEETVALVEKEGRKCLKFAGDVGKPEVGAHAISCSCAARRPHVRAAAGSCCASHSMSGQRLGRVASQQLCCQAASCQGSCWFMLGLT
jgi:NAD(P)-dependent dehydrogenase (short-subunit alcohol dehydrogenase family)